MIKIGVRLRKLSQN